MPIKSFVILVALLMIAAVVYIELASMPGKTARERGHPHADAISTLGWVGLLLGVAPWLIAMVWARMGVVGVPVTEKSASTAKDDEDDQEAS